MIKYPEWFKVGATVYFHGHRVPTEVLSIDQENGSWIGSEYGDQASYPLDEVSKHWFPNSVSVE